MKIGLGCDHAGYPLKLKVMKQLEEWGYEIVDYGTDSTEATDYPIYGHAVGRAVASGEVDRGIVICGSGIGISMAANKVPGVRCALCSEPYGAVLTRRHNDANVLGGRMIGDALALKIVSAFLRTEFKGGRHAKRVNMIEDLEK